MTILKNDVGTTTEGGPKPAIRLTAPLGYNVQLFKGGLWLLQRQCAVTLGTGNSSLIVVARGITAANVVVALQASSQALTHTYSSGVLTIKPATDGSDIMTSTVAQVITYLKGQSGLAADFLDFVAGGNGTGLLSVNAGTNLLTAMVNCWIPASQVTGGNYLGGGFFGGARGENSSVYADNRGGYPNGPGPLGSATVYATAEQGIHKWLNDTAGTPLLSVLQVAYPMGDDNTVSASNSGAGKLGLVVGFSINNFEVFVDETR